MKNKNNSLIVKLINRMNFSYKNKKKHPIANPSPSIFLEEIDNISQERPNYKHIYTDGLKTLMSSRSHLFDNPPYLGLYL